VHGFPAGTGGNTDPVTRGDVSRDPDPFDNRSGYRNICLAGN
jgi:hypothetical protein